MADGWQFTVWQTNWYGMLEIQSSRYAVQFETTTDAQRERGGAQAGQEIKNSTLSSEGEKDDNELKVCFSQSLSTFFFFLLVAFWKTRKALRCQLSEKLLILSVWQSSASVRNSKVRRKQIKRSWNMFFNREVPRAMVCKEPTSELIVRGSINDISGRKDPHAWNWQPQYFYIQGISQNKVRGRWCLSGTD